MKHLMIITFCLVLLSCSAAWAQESDGYVDGTIQIGGRFSDGDDDPGKVAEFETRDEDGTASLDMDIIAGNDKGYVAIEGTINNADDLVTTMTMKMHPSIQNTFSYKRYMHRLDHDYMENLQFRESADPVANIPGGKMLTHDDTDPCGEYGIIVSDLSNDLNVKLGKHVEIDWGYHHLARKGHKQTRSINHCSMCHVVARRTEVNEDTRDHSLGLSVVFSKINVMYQMVRSEFRNYAEAPRNYWDPAVHPTTGEKGAEFIPRTNYQDEEGVYATTPDSRKDSHILKFAGDLNPSNFIVGKLSLVNYENQMEGLEMENKYGAFRWSYHPGKKIRVNATISRENMDNDDVFVDLPTWREGRTGGGQNFDWTRQSAYNRDVTIAKLQTQYKLNRQNTLNLDYRYRSIDREYLELEQGSSETESVQNRIKAAWSSRSKRFRSKISLEYEMTDIPFANKFAMCEEAHKNDPFLPDNGFFYYFQRERKGDGSNQPSDSIRLNANVTLLSGGSYSINLQGTYQDEKNDNLNTFEWTRDQMTAGVNLFYVPSKKAVLSAGYNYLNIESNALFCVPVMDG
jgi:Putative outer membrane beta-barrel porin, MtrB/PioB